MPDNPSKDVSRCATCKFFKRGKWFPFDLKAGENIKFEDLEDQLSGECELLLRALAITNSNLCAMEALSVQETFGCSLHQLHVN